MALALLLSRLLLAAVFATAGLAKLADLPGSRRAVAGFGVPPRLAAPLGTLLPLAQLALALALLPRPAAWYGALGASLLLALFVAAIAANMAKGRTPDCHCFGQLHSAPVGAPTLVRNGLLAALALFVVVAGYRDPGASAVAWLGALTVGERAGLAVALLAVAVLAAQGWLLVQLLRQQGRFLVRLEAIEATLAAGGTFPSAAPTAPDAAGMAAPPAGLPVGSPAPGFALAGLHGETLTLDALRAAGAPVVLVFSDPGCGPCNALLPELGRWQREHAGRCALVLVSRGTAEENRAKAAEHGLERVLLQADREVQGAYQVRGTPSAVLVRADGTVGSALAEGAEQIGALMAQVAAAPHGLPQIPLGAIPVLANGHAQPAAPPPPPPAGPQVGEPAPAMSLPDLDGKPVELARLRGRPTVVLFWNPGCGFCQRMLDDLKAWERMAGKGTPRLLVVSTGGVEANRALGLRSTVVLDEGGRAMAAFGANGTPMAVLVDAQGRIASELAAGAEAVLALARGAGAGAAAS